MKFLFLHRFIHFFAQHQFINILYRNNNALCAAQPACFAHVVKSFDLQIYAADRLNLTFLIDRSGYGNILPDRNAGKTG